MQQYRRYIWQEPAGRGARRSFEKDFEADDDEAAIAVAQSAVRNINHTHPQDFELSEVLRIEEGTEITITQIAYAKNGMPKKIYMRWNEEDVVMDFTFANPRVNSDIDASIFVLPGYKNRIDMSKN